MRSFHCLWDIKLKYLWNDETLAGSSQGGSHSLVVFKFFVDVVLDSTGLNIFSVKLHLPYQQGGL